MSGEDCPSAQVWTKLGEGGRLVIPAEFRHALGVNPGDDLLVRLVGGELRILTVQEGIRQAQEIVRRYVPEGVSLVDELIAERRAEAAAEDAEEAAQEAAMRTHVK